eukprot:GHVU01078664.1.p1 GENE.GHVU01078664.1~~GHVU01078664.1.p1  ORF type:complete len:153 (+),score=11.57 GHVU01078664.1:785-1243(+)
MLVPVSCLCHHFPSTDGVPTIADLKLYLSKCRLDFEDGVEVRKVGHNGKLYKRTVHIGSKPEYFEITSAKAFDAGYHVSDIMETETGNNSECFQKYDQLTDPEKKMDANRCAVVHLETKNISLAFRTVSLRNEFVFLLRVTCQVVNGVMETN